MFVLACVAIIDRQEKIFESETERKTETEIRKRKK